MKVSNLEDILKCEIDRKVLSFGLDTASKTGWCLLKTVGEDIVASYGFININTPDAYFLYNEVIDCFGEIIKPEYKVIVEDTFFRFNPKMFRLISRIGAIAYTMAHLKGCEVKYLLATSARKKLGFKGNLKKKIFHQEFKEKLNLDITNEDILDAYALSLCGLIKED